jgi:ABC-type histidine transport system ATPase subunit
MMFRGGVVRLRTRIGLLFRRLGVWRIMTGVIYENVREVKVTGFGCVMITLL